MKFARWVPEKRDKRVFDTLDSPKGIIRDEPEWDFVSSETEHVEVFRETIQYKPKNEFISR